MKKIKTRKERIKRIKYLQLLLIIPIIILVLIKTTHVKAGIQDSTLVRNQKDGIYAIAPLSDKTHLYNLEMYQVNNKTAYCIEIGKKVATLIYNSTLSAIEQEQLTNLNQEQLTRLKLIAYFGYGYKNHNDYRFYMAAQELIWEYINNVDITWTNTLDIHGEKINIEYYKNEITNQIKRFTSNLSFGTSIKCKVGDNIILTDTNNSIQFYEITSQGNQSATISENNLTINISDTYIGTDKITLKRENYYSHHPFLYYFDSSQTLLSFGNIGDKIKFITLNIQGETLTTNLIDFDTKTNIPSPQASLSGAVYELYDKKNNLITRFTTDETGINTISNLYHDTYYIKQIKASTGYKLNDKIYKIDINSDTNKLTLEEEVIKSTIEINKLYEIEDNYQREANIKFEIYDNNNNLYNSLITTKLGPDKITLPYGIYTIKQINTTYGYDKVKDIKLQINDSSEIMLRYDLIDKKITTKLHITTKDKLTLENIKESNIKYKIKNKKTNEYLTYIDANNDTIDTFSTNKSGELTIPIKLSYGEYLIEQITSPTKYLENNNEILVPINDESEYRYLNNEIVINADYLNEPIIGKINVTTKQEIFLPENNNYTTKLEPRHDVEIELYYENNLINTYKTNNKGILEIDNLKLGNYCIKEKNTNKKECFTLINNDNKIRIIEKTVELVEKLKLSNVILNNIDTNKESIPKSTIELYYEDKLINTSITNEKGIIKISKLSNGKYCFKQTKVPENYIINNQKLCFEITNNDKEINLVLVNKLKLDRIKIPNTLSNSKNYLFIIITIPLLILIGVVLNKKKNSINNN